MTRWPALAERLVRHPLEAYLMNTEPNPELLKYTHLMLDIETMNNTPDSPMTSIAAVPFNPDSGVILAKEACFHVHVNLQDQIDLGLIPSASTILWWLGQSEEARTRLIEGQKTALTTVEALEALQDFVDRHGDMETVRVWGNGAGFDQPIVETSFRRVRRTPPWKFFNLRCFRTLKALRPDLCVFQPEVKHDALEDTYAQALNAIHIIQALPVQAALI